MARRNLYVRNVVLSEEILSKMEEFCKKFGLSRSELVRSAVLEYLRKFEKEKVKENARVDSATEKLD